MEPTLTVDPAGAIDAETPLALPRGATLDRYVVLEPLGQGGMGVVYSAFDPELDRRVALKVVHPRRLNTRSNGRTQRRLAREAQALAQLSHPHVLAVHDVGVVGSQLYVATELVDGSDLESWLRRSSRRRAEILEVFRQAGTGLAAAHEAGLVHRDFKLSNVMVGRDGRVRVVDFGLASRHDDGEAESIPRAVGTPTYAAPEQLAGQPVTAAADQFAFCVSLYRALCGQPPFPAQATESPSDEALWVLDEGPAAKLPMALRRLLRRGLRFEPEARYPSMEALLADLVAIQGKRRRWRRMAGLIGAAAAAAALVAGLFTVRQKSVCTGGEERFAAIWSDERQRAIASAFRASPLPYAEASWQAARTLIDRYAEQWSRMHDDACRATAIEGTQSADLLDRRMACLERRLHAVDALANALVSGGPVAEHAVDGAGALGSLAECADAQALLAETPLPEDPEQIATIGELRRRLANVEAQLVTRGATEGLELAVELAQEAETIGHWPLIADALLVQARFEQHMDQAAAADHSLERALEAAQAGGDDRAAATAFVHRVRVAGYQMADFERGARYARQAEAALARLGRPEELAARLSGNEGAMLVEEGRFAEALTAHRQAFLAWTKIRGPLHPQTIVAQTRVGDVLLETGALEDAERHFEGALDIARGRYGETHPLIAKLHSKIGTVLMQQGHATRAQDAFEQALEASRATLPPGHPYLAIPLTYLGHALVAAGDYSAATARYRRALEILEQAPGEPDARRISVVASGLGRAASSIGDYEEAARSYGRALELRQSVYGEEHPAVAETAYNLGEVAQKHGDPDLALSRFRQALRIWQRRAPDNAFLIAVGLTGVGEALLDLGKTPEALPLLERALRLHPEGRESEFLATTQFTLARALAAAGLEPRRAQVLAIAARDGFARGRASSQEEISEVEAWLADRSPAP